MILAIILLFLLVVARSGITGLLVVGVTWLAAGLLNPPIPTSLVWFIAFVVAFAAYEHEFS